MVLPTQAVLGCLCKTENRRPQRLGGCVTNRFRFMAFAFGFLVLSVPLFAHHGAASYDTGKPITVTGTVTEYIWTNPHVLLKLDVKGDSGDITHWVVEAWNPVTQKSRGWTKDTFKPGD